MSDDDMDESESGGVEYFVAYEKITNFSFITFGNTLNCKNKVWNV